MKKLFVSAMFIGLTSAAMAMTEQPQTNTVANDRCRDMGVSVQKDKNSVQVHTRENVDYNMRVTTGNGNSYEYDTRNSTSHQNHKYAGGKNSNDTYGAYSDNGGVREVDIRCYERK